MISQVVLSFGIPFALVPLAMLTRRGDVMGALVNRRPPPSRSSVITTVIIALNAVLLWETFVEGCWRWLRSRSLGRLSVGLMAAGAAGVLFVPALPAGLCLGRLGSAVLPGAPASAHVPAPGAGRRRPGRAWSPASLGLVLVIVDGLT